MTYNPMQWLTFFYIYCFLGWCFESTYVSLKQRRFVNRGFLKLPMLPIYGSGAMAILIVTIPVREHLWLVGIYGMISATLLELVTGAVMESLFKVKYWDYTNQPMNYKGYICVSSSIAWGFLAVLLTEVIHEPVEKIVLKMPFSMDAALVLVVSVLFVSDFVVSFKAAWDLRKLLEKLTAIRQQLEALRQQLEERGDEIAERFSAAKEEAEAHWHAARNEVYERMSASKAFFIRRLLNDNPSAASQKFGKLLDEIRMDIKHKHEDKKKKGKDN